MHRISRDGLEFPQPRYLCYNPSMPSKKQVVHASYPKLLKSIQSCITQTGRVLERATIEMYWSIGRLIHDHLKGASPYSGDGKGVFARLGRDLQKDPRTLYDAVRFYEAYPNLSDDPLSWSHYRHLAHIRDNRERARWQKRAVRERLSVKDFLALRSTKETPLIREGTLKAAPGLLYHYRVVKIKEEFFLDAGFENYLNPVKGTQELDNARIYRSVKEDGYELRLSKATKKDLYTYNAVVERVVDGDTLLVLLDCGFGIRHRERLRLRGIDAPEKKTVAGKRASDYVGRQLEGQSSMIIKTHRPDKYGRYLADVFLENGSRYLNQELVAQGLAGIV